jgi:outer membrane protein insertion porin family
VGDTQFANRAQFPTDYKFKLNEMRTSTGLAVQWLAPLGLFRFSFAYPLRYRDQTEINFGDDVERFQFSIGQAF